MPEIASIERLKNEMILRQSGAEMLVTFQNTLTQKSFII